MRIFKEMVAVTGLIVTKLDGSARGGIVVALARGIRLPVHAVGVGEKVGDLRPFDPRSSRGGWWEPDRKRNSLRPLSRSKPAC